MANYIVDTRSDVVDAGDGVLSLREALAQAETHAGADTITFSQSAFTPENSTIVLTQGQLSITQAGGPVTIQGDLDGDHTPDVTIDAGGKSGVLQIAGASSAQRADVTLEGMTITGGSNSYWPGGGGIDATNADLRIVGSDIRGNTGYYGGGIFLSGGSIALTGSNISDNTSSADGGGIFLDGADLTVASSLIAGNTAGVGFYGGNGGGIYIASGSSFFSNSTLSGNTAIASAGAHSSGSGSRGGAVWSMQPVSLTNCTVVGNRVGSVIGYFGDISTGLGGGIFVETAGSRIANTIIAGNLVSRYAPDAASDIYGGIVSNGHNLFSEYGIAGATSGDQMIPYGDVFTSVLASLVNNGGSTLTHALLPGSLAIGAGSNADAVDADGDPLATDQRGAPRIRGGEVDIGAVEGGEGTVVDGTEGPDLIVGTAAAEWIRGFGGADTLIGRGGWDTLFGGDGGDLIRGEAGNDYILAGDDDDTCGGGGGNDLLLSGDGGDVINGGGGNDILRGEDGADNLGGGYGADSLDGGDGADSLVGGDGNDTADGGDGADLVLLGAGNDRAEAGRGDTISGGDGDDTVSGTISSFVVNLGNGDDLYVGGSGSVHGGAGNDRLIGFGSGPLFGDDGNDALQSEFGTMYGGEGDDSLIGLGATMFGGNGDDRFAVSSGVAYGGAGDDELVRTRGSEATLYGGSGNDTLVGGDSFDSMTGGSGSDTFILLGSYVAVTDVVTDFASLADRIDLTALTAAGLLSGYADLAAVFESRGANTLIRLSAFNEGNSLTTGDLLLLGVTLTELDHPENFLL